MFGTKIAYKGLALKSHIEFAWAQEWEARDLDWEYEPVRFAAKEGSYIPDFGLENRALFIECKTYGARNVSNRFHLCRAPLLLIFGIPTHCYIRFKPANAARFLPGHLKTFASAYDLIRKAAA